MKKGENSQKEKNQSIKKIFHKLFLTILKHDETPSWKISNIWEDRFYLRVDVKQARIHKLAIH